jgi:hypothetical protein
MSGSLSIFRELYGLYLGAVPPRSLFWSLMIVAYIVSAAILWVDENRRAEDFRRALSLAKVRPGFVGHLYQFHLHPRVGVTPPKLLQEALNIRADKLGQPRTEYKEDCDVFVEAYIINENPGVGTVLEYELEIELDGHVRVLTSEPGFVGWNQMRTTYRIDPTTGKKEEDNQTIEPVPDLMELTAKPMQQGHGVEGWLHFVLERVSPLKLENNAARLRQLKTIDGYGGKHGIEQGRTSKRQTSIVPDPGLRITVL